MKTFVASRWEKTLLSFFLMPFAIAVHFIPLQSYLARYCNSTYVLENVWWALYFDYTIIRNNWKTCRYLRVCQHMMALNELFIILIFILMETKCHREWAVCKKAARGKELLKNKLVIGSSVPITLFSSLFSLSRIKSLEKPVRQMRWSVSFDLHRGPLIHYHHAERDIDVHTSHKQVAGWRGNYKR